MLTILSSEELPSEVVDEIGEISERIGFTPNVARLLALTPSHFVGWWRYFDELMQGPSGLSKTQREMIAVVVSAEADCPYCEVAHAAALGRRDESPMPGASRSGESLRTRNRIGARLSSGRVT